MRNSYQLNKNKLTIKKMNNKIIFPNLQIITLFFLIHCTYAQIIYSLHQTRPTPYTSIRKRAFSDTLEKDAMRLSHTDWGYVEKCYIEYLLYGKKSKELMFIV